MYDIAIIGGGINGCGIARDAAGRGYSVVLAEMGDLASGTSSWSTKLVHGGLRYLEHYEFRLVREALAVRAVLLDMAPHIIRPLRFILPHHAGLRPAWLLRLGLFLYDHIGGRGRLEGSRSVDLRHDPAGAVLNSAFTRGFAYSDCQVDDARLVVLNARCAADHGARIQTRTRVAQAGRVGDHWALRLVDARSGRQQEIAARLLINAAGPWVDDVRAGVMGDGGPRRIRLVKGSHIVVRRIGTHEQAFIFQNGDGRIVFAIPFERDFTLIGTTDEDYTGDPGDARASDAEIDYLCAAASTYFAAPVSRDAIVWTFAGVRSLFDDGAGPAQAATRDYVIETSGSDGQARRIDIFGGKITTYRRLAEAVLDHVTAALGPRTRGAWTRGAPLPGGDFPVGGDVALSGALGHAFPFLEPGTARRLIGSYGTRAFAMLDGATGAADLGVDFGAGLSEREVLHLCTEEWASTADDILWRRSKLGLKIDAAGERALEDWLARHAAVTPAG